MTDKIVFDQNKLELLKSKQDLVFKLFATSITTGEKINSFNPNAKKLWIILSGTRAAIEKTKKFINSLCYPVIKEKIKIEQKSAEYLRSKNYINNLIQEYQVYIEVSNQEVLIQGENEDVAQVKNILDIEKFRTKESVVFCLDDKSDEDEIICINDPYELFDEYNSIASINKKNEKPSKELNGNQIKFVPRVSTLNDQDCEIINFIPSTEKINFVTNSEKINFVPSSERMEKVNKSNNSASLTEYAKLFNMDFDKDSEKLNKVKRIDKLISVMPEDQKILALNHLNNYQRKNSKKTQEASEKDCIFSTKNKSPRTICSNDVALNNFEDIMKNFNPKTNSNKQEIKFETKMQRNRARSRTEKDFNQADNSQNIVTFQANAHGRSKSSAPSKKDCRELRHIIIDGSNVAREHGKLSKSFSCRGIKIAVDYFLNRGHKDVYAMVPRFRRGNSDKECPSLNPEILDQLDENGYLAYTPSRYVEKKLIVSYDDRFILEAALHYEGIIVSNDNYRDLMEEKPEWKKLVETSLLQFSFIGDLFMVASDPLGRKGPTLDEFLSKPSDKSKPFQSTHSSSVLTASKPKNSQNVSQIQNLINFKQPQIQTAKKKNNRSEERENLIKRLREIFPNDENKIRSLVYEYREVEDINFFVEKIIKRK